MSVSTPKTESQLLVKRTYPAINIKRSGTRREELILNDNILQRIWILRKLLSPMEDVDAIEFLIKKLQETQTNENFFLSMKRTSI